MAIKLINDPNKRNFLACIQMMKIARAKLENSVEAMAEELNKIKRAVNPAPEVQGDVPEEGRRGDGQ